MHSGMFPKTNLVARLKTIQLHTQFYLYINRIKWGWSGIISVFFVTQSPELFSMHTKKIIYFFDKSRNNDCVYYQTRNYIYPIMIAFFIHMVLTLFSVEYKNIFRKSFMFGNWICRFLFIVELSSVCDFV